MKPRIELAAEPRDFAATARLCVLLGFGAWLFWAVGFSLLYAAFENRSFGDVFPAALKTGVLFGLVMAVVSAFGTGRLRATVQFKDKKDFAARLNMAISQLGYIAAPTTGDFLTFRPSFQTGGVGLGMVSVQLEDAHAVIVGPKMHVKKIVKRLETI